MNTSNTGFINYLQLEETAIWTSLLGAAESGLVFIDRENDAVTATTRLLLTYPDLHEVLNFLTDAWFQKRSAEIGHNLIQSLHIKKNG
ncbi:MAG: hypothetical protein ACI86H_002484 [bacterium]|jgi:hypothetical protein